MGKEGISGEAIFEQRHEYFTDEKAQRRKTTFLSLQGRFSIKLVSLIQTPPTNVNSLCRKYTLMFSETLRVGFLMFIPLSFAHKTTYMSKKYMLGVCVCVSLKFSGARDRNERFALRTC